MDTDWLIVTGVVLVVGATIAASLTQRWYDTEARFEDWLACQFGENAPLRLAVCILVMALPYCVWTVGGDLWRIWGV